MKKYIIFLLFFYLSLFSKEIDIANIKTITTLNNSYYLIDVKSSFSSNDILSLNNLNLLQKSSYGALKNTPIWTKVNLVNSSNIDKNIVLVNKRAGVDKLDIYIYKDEKLITSYKVGDLREITNRSFKAPKSNIEITIKAKEKLTIITKVYSYGNNELSWIIQTLQEFLNDSMQNYFILSLFGGFLIALIIYNLSIYFNLKDKLYLIYISFVLNVLIHEFAIHGIFYYLFSTKINLFFITLIVWLSASSAMVFSYLFAIYFFDLKKNAPKFYKLFKILVIYHSMVILFYLFALLEPTFLYYYKYFADIAFIEFLLLLFFTFWVYRKAFTGAIFYTLAYTFWLISVTIQLLSVNGVINLTLFSEYSVIVGSFFEALFLSFALTAKLKAIRDENENIKKQLIEKSKFETIGATISYISHQWKAPLNQLSSLILRVQSDIDNHSENLIENIKETMDKMEDKVAFINSTQNEIKELFNDSNNKKEFSISKEIEKVLNLNRVEILNNHIEIKKELDEIKLIGNSHLFIHAIHNIIYNSIEVFKLKNIKNPKIIIKTYKLNEKIYLTIEDNAGGIDINLIDSIFEPFITDKENGSGLGLSLVNSIITTKLKGDIKVENSTNGLKFTISF